MENPTSPECGARRIVCLATASIGYAGICRSALNSETSGWVWKAVYRTSSGYETASDKRVLLMIPIRAASRPVDPRMHMLPTMKKWVQNPDLLIILDEYNASYRQ